MLWAFLDDIAQRLLTSNKREQRENLRGLLRRIGWPARGSVLDFGCGTGLFARTLAENGVRYVGYDIDPGVVHYARRLYPPLVFTSDEQEIEIRGPYDYAIANCCFHHIPDAPAVAALESINRMLRPTGCLVMIDILAPEADRTAPLLHRIFSLFERGECIRRHGEYIRLLETVFDVERTEAARSHLFSMKASPLYTNLGMYLCRPRTGGRVPVNSGGDS